VFKRTKYLIAFSFSLIIAGVGIYFYLGSTYARSVCYNWDTWGWEANQRTLCFAREQVGVKEVPELTNKGVNIDIWNDKSGCSKGSAWCASFLSYELYMGHNSWDIKTCSTLTMVDQFKAKHKVYTFASGKVTLGDIVYRTRPSGGVSAGHVGLVSSVYSSGNFQTIEGNTACSDVKNDCVRYRYYSKYGAPLDSDNISAGVGNWTKILRW